MNKEHTKLAVNMGLLLKGYMLFPLVFGGVFMVLSIVLFFVSNVAGLIAAIAFVIYLVALYIFYHMNNIQLERGMVRFARQYGGLEGQLISDFPIPYVITATDGTIVAFNDMFSRIYDDKSDSDNICQVFHELDVSDLKFEGAMNNISVVYDSRDYRLCIKHMQVTDDLIDSKIVLLPEHEMTLCIMYLFDETEIIGSMRKTQSDQMVIGSVCIDNYEEILSRSMDVQKNVKVAMIDNVIGSYFAGFGGVVRKLERDRYFVVFKRKYLTNMQRTKFELLDRIKNLEMDDDRQITISVGIGVGEDYALVEKAANSALELALGRGGDQVVVKEGERIYFYGGKTKQVEKNTRVRARVKAIALRDLLISKEKVVVMGHKNADVDCFAAAMGIYKAAKELGKEAHIIVNEGANSVKPMLKVFKDDEEYRQGVFISPDQAEDYVNDNTVLVIVDVNKPDIFELPELVQKTSSVVLIDHHLQSGDKIDNLVLSYVEPAASSASEMVTELLQYVTDNITLKKMEAEALYGGILIDTDSFTRNTGVRTFEAAAFLRKAGIDIQAVNRLFLDSLQTTKIKAYALGTAEEVVPGFVVAESLAEGVSNPTVVAAQVANELLNVQNVKASFVVTNVSGRVYISARSVGDTNVQLVMERMGGGGHLNVAGCQLQDMNVEDAKKALTITLKKMIEDRDII